MIAVQPVHMPVSGTVLARSDMQVQTASAVAPSGDAGGARNDTTRDSGAQAERAARLLSGYRSRSQEPVGPPPAFEANVLEAEREKLREPAETEPAPAPVRAEAPARPAEAGTAAGEEAADEPDEASARTGTAPARESEERPRPRLGGPEKAYEDARATTAPDPQPREAANREPAARDNAA